MKQLELTIVNPTGLHARPAAVFVKTAKKFKSKIKVEHGPKKANAKSVISVLALGVEKGGQIRLIVEGEDEDAALEILKNEIESGLGDDLSQPPQPANHPNGQNQKPASGPPAAQTDSNRNVVRAIPAASGVAIGPLHQFQPGGPPIKAEDLPPTDPAQNRANLAAAIKTAQTELTTLHRQVHAQIGAAEAAIFEAHLAILDDPELFTCACEQIDAGSQAGPAWSNAVETMAATLAGLKNELLAGRAADVHDVGRRVLRILAGGSGNGASLNLPSEPAILIARDLSPSDTVTLDSRRVLGFCTAVGGANGHTAILARALGIPAVVGAGEGVLSLPNGTPLILNGDSGTLTLEPDADMLAAAQTLQQQRQARRTAELHAAAGQAVTLDNHRVEVAANIGSVADARQAVKFGAEAVGLLRTEFLFLDQAEAPTENSQFDVYRDIVLALEGRPVIIRTLDIGGDKPLPYLSLPPEENPFLGQRGIRLCLAHPDILRSQLRAILRAASYGRLRIMFPMITTFEDWTAAKRLVEEIRAELNAPAVELGIMIEVPAAALLADAFAREVDFFSIGTNDLTQYTLAMDRTNPAVANQADGLHPAVLKLIKNTVQAAHAAGKWVGVCGELAANAQAAPVLVGLGVDELSVSTPAIPAVKAQIRSLTLEATQQLAEQALRCATAAAVRKTVHDWGVNSGIRD
jgi:phosphocarrier protein FPr